jgi:hypothetical protein
LEGAILIGPSPIFSEHWALPNRSASLDPQLQIRNKCGPLIAYLFSSYTGELNLGKPYETKLRCFWESLGNLRNPMGTHWEQRREKENLPSNPPLPPKKKNRPPHEFMLSLLIGCMKKILFPKLFVTIFGLG